MAWYIFIHNKECLLFCFNLFNKFIVAMYDSHFTDQNALIEITFNRYTAIEGEIIDADSGENLA
jgi:hypothetical protein